MSCMKTQLLSLLYRILDDILKCKDVDCCRSVIKMYIEVVKEKTFRELDHELFT